MHSQRKLFLIFGVGLFLRLLLLAFFWDKPLTIVDETHYQAIAENILKNQEFALDAGQPTAIRPPLYPAVLSFIYWLTGGVHLNAVRIVQIVASILLIYVVYLLGNRIFDDRTGLLAAFIFAVYSSFLFFTHFLLTEVLFTLLLVSFVWFFLKALEERKWRNYLISGLFLGLGALTRSILSPFLLLALGFLFLVERGSMMQRMKGGLLLFIGFAVVVFPWTVRNTLLFHQPVLIDTMGGLNLYMGNYEHTPMDRAWAAVDLPPELAWYQGHEHVLSGMNEAQKQQWAKEEAKQFILEHKLLTTQRGLIKAANFWGLEREIIGCITNNHFPGINKGVYLVPLTVLIFSAYILVMIGAVFGMIYNLSEKTCSLSLILLLSLFFTALHAIVFGHSRYHLPLIPLLILPSSWAFLNIKAIWRNRSSWSFAASTALINIFFGIWGREVLIDALRYSQAFRQ